MNPVAYMTTNEDGDPTMLFFDAAEAKTYCYEDEAPIGLVDIAEFEKLSAENQKLKSALIEAARGGE